MLIVFMIIQLQVQFIFTFFLALDIYSSMNLGVEHLLKGSQVILYDLFYARKLYNISRQLFYYKITFVIKQRKTQIQKGIM